MCANPDKATTEEFRNRKRRQRTYKVIRRESAKPQFYPNVGVPYQPGRNVDHRAAKTYLGYARGATRGFHCFLNRRKANAWRNEQGRSLTVVCVTFDPIDVIVVEKMAYYMPRQVVVRALHISERAWKQAGLPATKGGGS